MKKISGLVIICLLFFDLKLQAQHIDTVSENIESKISLFLQSSGNEKAYLQFDKSYYAAGDTIYFKAYITLGERHKLSVLSGVLHVDFINTINHIDRSLKLELKDGTACGDFALPDSLPTGNYRVRAYTNWMRNDGSNFFYEKLLPVYSLNNKAILNKSKKQQPIKQPDPEIQFMPEGGNSVVGIVSKIAFKAIDANGLGIDIKGKVNDNESKTVCTFSSSHFGMGSFNIKPEPGKTYKADVIFANGFHQVLTLPVALQDGITISVNNDTISKAVVRIKASNDFYRKNKGAIFQSVIYSGGKITKFKFNLDSGTTQFEILKRRLQTGVSTVTVFSPDGVPLCERLFFVQNYDKLNIEITGVKDIYNKREKVNVQLMIRNRADSAVSGHFSAAVISERVASYHPNDDNILSHFLLTADLKGYIEQPGYYFSEMTDQKLRDLDLVMLTNGYRRFEWQQVLNYGKRDLLYKPEKGLEISGTIKTLFNKPINKGTVTLIAANGGPVLSTIADDKGMFKFDNLLFYDTTHFVLSAVKANGKNSTKITYNGADTLKVNNVLSTSEPLIDSLPAGETLLMRKELLERLNYRGEMLKEVKIKAIKPLKTYETQSLAGAGYADQVIKGEELQQIGGRLITSLNGRLRGVVFLSGLPFLSINLNGLNGAHPMRLFVDGAESDAKDIGNYTTSEIATVEVLKSAAATIYGVEGADGILIVTTKKGGGRNDKDITSKGILSIKPIGFYKARVFYSPKYNGPNTFKVKPDLISTTYWNPNIQSDKNGNASFDYYTSDGVGKYQILFEGIDGNGNIGRHICTYVVH